MQRCPVRRWRVSSVTVLGERYRELVQLVRNAGPAALCYERAAMRVQRDIFQAPEMETFDLIDELVSLEGFFRGARARLGGAYFDLWFALRIWAWKAPAVVDAEFSPWALSTLYERLNGGWLEAMDNAICDELLRAGWWDMHAEQVEVYG